MRKRTRITAVLASAVCGCALVITLCLLSRLVSRLFPYHDLPMMPKPLFVYVLLPGFIAGEAFDNKWVSNAAFFLANTLVYSTLFFSLMTLFLGAETFQRVIARLHDREERKPSRTDG